MVVVGKHRLVLASHLWSRVEVKGMAACVECHEEITHPLCAACLEEAIIEWLRERGEARLSPALRAERFSVQERYGETTCIKCHQGMALCSYCYFLHIGLWLHDAAPRLLPEFRRFFGFELSEEPLLVGGSAPVAMQRAGT